MGIKAYLGNQFEHTHENKIFNELYDLLEAHCRSRNVIWFLLGNFYVGGRELDALLIKPNAITIIDFKDYGGKVEYSEDCPWKIGDVEVKGGSSVNPLQQLKRNREAFMSFCRSKFGSFDCNWSHISAAVVFHKAIEYDKSLLKAPIDRWFHITDMNVVVRDLEAIVSNKINMLPEQIGSFISSLGIKAYIPDEAIGIRALSKAIEDKCKLNIELTRKQNTALQEFIKWLNNKTGIFRLTGMTSTGKKTLLPFLLEAIRDANFEPLALLPNARFALKYQGIMGEGISIYTWLYTRYPVRFEKHNNSKLAIYDVREELVADDVIPIIIDAQLFSDEEFEVRDRRYGSGQLITDFVSKFDPERNGFVVIGDQYQLTKGSLQRSFFSNTIFNKTAFNISDFIIDEQILSYGEADSLSKLQAHLVQSIEKNRFNYLPRDYGGRLRIKNLEESYEWVPDTTNINADSMMVVATHEQVREININVKKEILHHDNLLGLGPNDRIDFYNRTPIIVSDDDKPDIGENQRWINIGELGIVDHVDDEIELIKQPLAGRNEPIALRFQKALCRIPGLGQVQFRYLLNFFESERPELDTDSYVALLVIALNKAKPFLDKLKQDLPDKSSDHYEAERKRYELLEYQILLNQGYLSAAHIRLAHAMTVHRAQGRSWPSLWVNAGKSASSSKPNNSNYFRWFYTASISAKEDFCVVQMPFLDPLVNSVFKRANDFSIIELEAKKGFFYNQSRLISEQEKIASKPSGFSDNNLMALYLELHDRLKGSSWEINRWLEYAFQVVITFRNDSNGNLVRIRMHYNKNFVVTNKVHLEGLESDKLELDTYLAGKFQPESDSMAEAIDALEKSLARYGFVISGGTESNYRVLLQVTKAEGLLEVEVNANKEGMISSIRLLKATSEIIAEQFEEAVINHENLR